MIFYALFTHKIKKVKMQLLEHFFLHNFITIFVMSKKQYNP